MAPPYRDSFPSDHDHLDLHYSSSSHHIFFPITPQPSSSSSSSLSFPALDHSNSDDHPLPIELKHEGGGIMACNNDQIIGNHEDHEETGLRFTIWKQIDKRESSSCYENNHNTTSTHNDLVKWSSSSSSSSKIKFMINSNQTETATRTINNGQNFQDFNPISSSPLPSAVDQTNKRTSAALHDGSAIIRTCSDCNTTKTPLWRSGPRGPKIFLQKCAVTLQRLWNPAKKSKTSDGGSGGRGHERWKADDSSFEDQQGRTTQNNDEARGGNDNDNNNDIEEKMQRRHGRRRRPRRRKKECLF